MNRRHETRGAAVAYWLITISSWCVLNGLGALGLLVLFFILFANASFEGFFREGGNLSAHYLVAAPAARALFQHLIGWLFAGAFALLAAMRVRCLIADLRGGSTMPPSNPATSAI